MKVTVLIENTSSGGLLCEHGLSLLIECDGRRILLDAGTTNAFYANARQMGLSLEGLDAVVLSHGHYDHSGGFDMLFREHPEAKVYACRSALEPYYSGVGEMHEISIPEAVRAQVERFIPVDGIVKILPGAYLVPHSTPGLEAAGARAKLFKMSGGQLSPDDFAHEQSLVFDTEKGLVIFNSCSHGGVEAIIREAKAACGGKPVHAYVGGLHMKGKANGQETCAFTEAQLDSFCAAIRSEGISALYTGHCTGAPALAKLQERLGETIQVLTTGLQFDL